MGTPKAFKFCAETVMVQSLQARSAHFTVKTTNARMNKIPQAVHNWLSKIGTKGGKVTSPAKAAAVRENGKLGGRPRKAKGQTN